MSLRSWIWLRVAPQIDAYTWYRYRLLRRILGNRSFRRCLEIGSGGGVESMTLGRYVQSLRVIDVDGASLQRTRAKVRARLPKIGLDVFEGHLLDFYEREKFDLIVMLEVLEHIQNAPSAICKVKNCLDSNGLAILSTPTHTFGLLPGDKLSTFEDGGHVRAGYDGWDLDVLLSSESLVCEQRSYFGGSLTQRQHIAERALRRKYYPLGVLFGLVCRPLIPLLELDKRAPAGQISVIRHTVQGIAQRKES